MKQVTKSRKDDFSKFDSKNVLEGKTVLDEFKIIKTENRKNEKKRFEYKNYWYPNTRSI